MISTLEPSLSPVRPKMASAGTQTPVSTLLQHVRANSTGRPGMGVSKLTGPSPMSSAAAMALSSLCKSTRGLSSGSMATALKMPGDAPASSMTTMDDSAATVSHHPDPGTTTFHPPTVSSFIYGPPTTTTPRHGLSVSAQNQKKKAKYYDDGMHAKTNTASGAVATYYYPQGFPEPTGTAIPHNYPFISQVGHNNDDGGHARMQVFLDATNHFVAQNPMSPPLSRSPTNHHQRNQMEVTPHSLVTPSSSARKAGASTYSRKKKSLGLLAQHFIEYYKTGRVPGDDGSTVGSEFGSDAVAAAAVAPLPNTFGSVAAGDGKVTVSVDDAASTLAVERRRIYDIINILESVEIVVKISKTNYEFRGIDNLTERFCALLQRQEADIDQENKGLNMLSQKFLRLFLKDRRSVLRLMDASAELGLTEVNDFQSNGVAVPGIKTKIRRLYDIANVFCSIGIIEKTGPGDQPRKGQRPTFRWNFKYSPDELTAMATSGTTGASGYATTGTSTLPNPTVAEHVSFNPNGVLYRGNQA